jgi:hypothetical protein
VHHRDVLHDGESESGSARLATARGIDPVEALKETREVLFINAGALVSY